MLEVAYCLKVIGTQVISEVDSTTCAGSVGQRAHNE